jgi:hypothetical protein
MQQELDGGDRLERVLQYIPVVLLGLLGSARSGKLGEYLHQQPEVIK